MGTNFYWLKEEKPPCECCGRPFDDARLHIGKSSVGWCFALHVVPEDGIHTLDDWRELLKQPGRIEDEYGNSLSVEDMLARITDRSGRGPGWSPSEYAKNSSQPGPNGLVRSVLNGHCIGHGDGTFDYFVGEFS